MFPQDECLRCGHTYEEHEHGLIAPCNRCGRSACPDFIAAEQFPLGMGV